MKILLDLLDLLDDPHVTGESVVNRLKSWGVKHASSKTIGTTGKTTDFVSVLITGSTFCSSPFKCSDSIVSSRASILSALPLMVLISPLCTMKRFGCALSQLGFVFVLNLE